jgi:type IV secretion system protein VirB4
MFARTLNSADAFDLAMPLSQHTVLTKRGTVLGVLRLRGADPGALSDDDKVAVARLAQAAAESLPNDAALTQYLIHLDNQKVDVARRADDLSDNFSQSRQALLNTTGVADTRLYFAYEFSDPDVGQSKGIAAALSKLSGLLFDANIRRQTLTQLISPNSTILNGEALGRLLNDSLNALDTLRTFWGQLGDCQLIHTSELWGLAKFLATGNPHHLLCARPEADIPDELDIALLDGDIQEITLDHDPCLKLHGSTAHYMRLASCIAFPKETPAPLLALNAGQWPAVGTYVISHHYTPFNQLQRAALFIQQRNALERSRMSIGRMFLGKETRIEDDKTYKNQQDFERLEVAEASNDRWGRTFTTIAIMGADPAQVIEQCRAFGKALAVANIQAVWESVGLPHAYMGLQLAGQHRNARFLKATSAYHGRVGLLYAPHHGQPLTDTGDEATIIFQTSSGDPFHFSLMVHDRAFAIGTGAIGSGKTFFKNTHATHALKYDGFIRAVDVDSGTKCLADIFSQNGAGYFAVHEHGALNPFISARGASDATFAAHMLSLIRLLLDANDTEDQKTLTAEEQALLDKAIDYTLRLPAGKRSMHSLAAHLPALTKAKLSRWLTPDGLYRGVFDAYADAIGDATHRMAVWNLQHIRDQPKIMRPVMLDLFYRTTRAFEDHQSITRFKLLEVDEAHIPLQIPAFRDFIVSKIRTWRKWGAGITLWSQSPREFQDTQDWATIRSAASTFIFLADREMNEDMYRSAFGLKEGDIAAIRRLVPKREAFIYQPSIGVRKTVILNVDAMQYAINTSRPREALRRAELIRELGLKNGLRQAADELAAELNLYSHAAE